MKVTPFEVYVVTTGSSCTVTDAHNGKVLCTATAGEQKAFMAISPEIILSDPAADISKPKANFSGALALLGKQGGGSSAPEVAPGYLRLSYIHCKNDAYIDTGAKIQTTLGCRIIAEISEGATNNYLAGAVRGAPPYQGFVPLLAIGNDNRVGYTSAQTNGTSSCNHYPTADGGTSTSANASYVVSGVLTVEANYGANSTWKYKDKSAEISRPIVLDNYDYNFYLGARNYGADPTYYHYTWKGNIFSAQLTSGAEVVHDYVPAIRADGVVVFYDKVTGEAKPSISNEAFAAGITTRAELEFLIERLPYTGGELSLSVPAFWMEDQQINEKLNEVGLTKGWTLAIAETRSVETAASTYGLRRTRSLVWCRKQAAEYGSYVDASGNRWHVERCAAIYGPLGSDPTAYGYEPFDSVEQAAEEWGLTPVRELPEEENLITETE